MMASMAGVLELAVLATILGPLHLANVPKPPPSVDLPSQLVGVSTYLLEHCMPDLCATTGRDSMNHAYV